MADEKKSAPAEKKSTITLRSLFSNNKFVFAFSLIVAFCMWIWVSVEKSPVVENVITVPVQIDTENSVPSQLGLQVFGNSQYSIDVTVSGKKFIVSTLTADDIRVTAQTNYVDSAGSKSLTLKAVPNSSKDFEITALSQSYISVFFDTLKEAEFALTPNIISPTDSIVPEDCILGNVVFSKSTVSVSGPASEINRITGVSATVNIDDILTATTTVTPTIELTGALQSELSNVTLNAGNDTITMTLPVLKEVVLPTTVTFRNAPASYISGSLNKTVNPSSVKAAVPVEKIDEIKEISVGYIDFADLDVGYNTFVFKTSDISDYSITDNVKSFKVTVNMNGMVSTSVSIPNNKIVIKNPKSGFTSAVTTAAIQNVKIVGPSDAINALTADAVTAEIDLSNTDVTEGNLTVPVNISVSGNSVCWASGTYSAAITSQKTQ